MRPASPQVGTGRGVFGVLICTRQMYEYRREDGPIEGINVSDDHTSKAAAGVIDTDWSMRRRLVEVSRARGW